MPVEFIGMIQTRDQSESRPARGPVIDRDYLRRFARAHEDAGFDRVLIGYSSSQPDGLLILAMLTDAVPLLIRPTNSSITFGRFPAASTRAGDSIRSGMRSARPATYPIVSAIVDFHTVVGRHPRHGGKSP